MHLYIFFLECYNNDGLLTPAECMLQDSTVKYKKLHVLLVALI